MNHQRQLLEQETGLQVPEESDAGLQADWEIILNHTRALQQRNQRNGLLLDVHLKLNQRGLSTMSEQRSLSRMYDPTGHASAGAAPSQVQRVTARSGPRWLSISCVPLPCQVPPTPRALSPAAP